MVSWEGRLVDEELDQHSPTSEPSPARRWVKAAIAIVVVLVLLVLAFVASTGGNHVPGRHLSTPARAGIDS